MLRLDRVVFRMLLADANWWDAMFVPQRSRNLNDLRVASSISRLCWHNRWVDSDDLLNRLNIFRNPPPNFAIRSLLRWCVAL